MPRFVVLRHETPPHYPRPLHWDLMLEGSQRLATWALLAEPKPGAVVSADVLGDHRLDFLNFEGALSGDRGHVTRWDSGTYETVRSEPGLLVVHLTGQKLTATVTIRSNPESPHKAEIRLESDE